jgi:hypothetical protein
LKGSQIECLEQAERCLKLAAKTKDESVKNSLIEFAGTWMDLAEKFAKVTELDEKKKR